MSSSPEEQLDDADAHLQHALLAFDAEIRNSTAKKLASQGKVTTAQPEDNQSTLSQSTVDGGTPIDDPQAVRRLEKLRRTLEILSSAGQARLAVPGNPETTDQPMEFELPQRYDIVTKLGQGGFGVVVLAFDTHLKRRVAIKLPKPDVLLTKRMVARFLREAQHVAQLDHPNIIPVLATDETAPLPFIVYHYCHGPTLAQWLSQQREPITCKQAVRIVALLAEAIHHAHQRGILHRDLKPGNILLETATASEDRHGFQDQRVVTIPRITDFGISKIFNESSADATSVGLIIGTLNYMAPEQIRGQQNDVGWHSDVYSLGVILFELLTRERPFAAENASELLLWMDSDEVRLRRLRPDATRDLEAIVQRALSQKIESRYASALQFAEDLHNFLDDRPVNARPLSSWTQLQRWAKRQPVVATLGGICCLLLLVAIFMGMSYFRQIKASLAASAAANQELTRANAQARSARDKATQLATVLSEQLYVADMAAAADALRKKDILRYQPLIEKYLPRTDGPTSSHPNSTKDSGDDDTDDLIAHDQLRDAAWQTLWNLGHRPGKTLLSSNKTIHHIAASNSLDLFALCGGDGLVRLIDSKSLQEVRNWPASQGELRSVAFSPDDQHLATIGERGSVSIWNTHTGEHLHRFQTQARQAYQIVWQDAETVITTGNDPVVHLWNWRTGEETAKLAKHGRGIEGLAISPDRRTLISAGDDGLTCVWNLADKSLSYTLEPTPGRITDVVFCASHPWLFTCDILGKTRRLNLTSAPNSHDFVSDLLKAAESVACSPDGRLVATGSREGVIQVSALTSNGLRIKAQTEFGDAWQAHTGRVNDLQFTADGQSLLSVGQDGQVKLWRATSATNSSLDMVETIGVPEGCSTFLAELADNSCLACVADKACRWQPETGLLEMLGDFPAYTQVMIADPASSRIFTSSSDGRVMAWRIVSQDGSARLEQVWSYPFASDSTERTGLAYCPPRNWLVVAANSPQDELVVLDARTGARCQTSWKHPELIGRIRDIAISPSGEHLAAIYGKRIGIWNVNSGEATILTGHSDTVSTIAFDPSGLRLATGAEDRCIRLWNVATGELIKELRHHQDEIRSVLFSPDGKSLASTDRGGQSLLWKLNPPVVSLELDKQGGETLLPTTWHGKMLFRMSAHHWIHADAMQ